MPICKGDSVNYGLISGEVYDAVVTNVRPGNYVDVAITIPGTKEPFELHAVRAAAQRMPFSCAWPKEILK